MNETKEAIKQAFIKLYNLKPYEKINIKELCLEAPVARTTFYEYYENLGDLKAEIEDDLIDGILDMAKEKSNGNLENIDLEDYFGAVLAYIKGNWDVNYAFLVKQPNFAYISKWKEAIKYHFKLRFPSKTGIPNYGLIADVIASAVIGAYTYWMQHPDEMDAEKINEISVKAMGLLPKII